MNGNFRVAAVAGALAILATLPATAQQQDVVRIRGTIERVEGGNCVVKARDGTELKLAIAEKPQSRKYGVKCGTWKQRQIYADSVLPADSYRPKRLPQAQR